MAAVVGAFVSKLAFILMGMAKEEVEMLLGVPGEITKLETMLGDLSSILADAERKRISSTAVERWVRELKDAMYDVDDVLDLCQIMEGGKDPKAQRRRRSWKNIPKLSCFRNPVATHEIGKKIQALNKRLSDIADRSSRFGFIIQQISHSTTNTAATSSSNSNSRMTGASIVRSDVVGENIEQDTKKIVDLLTKRKVDAPVGSKEENMIIAAAITGAGGIGKTTLAKMVFNDSTVEENFDMRIWLSVNQEVNQISVLQNVLAALGCSHDGSIMGDKALLEHLLNQAVRQKKLFLVMDDVWRESENVWSEVLRVPLVNAAAPGSRVLVTTRNDGVARKMKAQHLHRVHKLQEEDAWVLLKNQVVLNESDRLEVDGLKDIGIKIVERCDGLPLAIKVLGGLLLTISRTRDSWSDVCNHFAWSIEEIGEDINKAIYLSYEELPSHLKQCFIYCSLFPKNELIRRHNIIQLWIAEGYVHTKLSSKLPEDLGSEYYKELVSRNLLEPNNQSNGQCTMHDVVRSFAQYITKDEGVIISERAGCNNTLGISKLRHLSITEKTVEWAALQKHVSLRTLMLFGSNRVDLNDFWRNLSCLRVINLYKVNLAELPDSICHLKHLRYLALSATPISTIPHDIGDLIFLQALDLGGCSNISQLPNSILKLRKLRLLNIRGTKINSVPRGFGKLEDLVVLAGFPTNLDDGTDDWCSLEELGSLSKLQLLDITGLEKASSGSVASRAMLCSKHHLRELALDFKTWLGDNKEVEANISMEEQEQIKEVLGNLFPPTCIEELSIESYFGSDLPEWTRTMSVFGSLRKLVLEGYMCCKQLPSELGQLPYLYSFWVEQAPCIQYIGHDFLLPSIGSNRNDESLVAGTRIDSRQPHHMARDAGVAFQNLTVLGFEDMSGWIEWDWEQHVQAMPTLEGLLIDNCKLQRLPPGLAHHAGQLVQLDLRNFPYLVSVENFPSLVELKTIDNPRLQRVSNCPSLQKVVIFGCPQLKLLEDLPSLESIGWKDFDAETLPEYLRELQLNKLTIYCRLSLLQLISLQDDTSEWCKICHVQQLKAYASGPEKILGLDGFIYYTKEPYSFQVVVPDSTVYLATDEHEQRNSQGNNGKESKD